MPTGAVSSLSVWPVKSMGGGHRPASVALDRRGLAGDRTCALVDQRPLRAGHVVSARNLPRVLRWSAGYPDVDLRLDDPPEPVVTGPDGRRWEWSDPALRAALSEDVGAPVALARSVAGHQDLSDSVLVTTEASHHGVEALFGQPLEVERWRTNLHLRLDAEAFAEHGWEGRRLVVGTGAGAVVLRLLHPCRRCTIPTWAPGGASRTPELLRWFHREHAGRFGINARVEVPGTIGLGDHVQVL